MSDFLLILIAMNLVAAAATALVLALRRPMRRLFGAGVAYALWSVVPLAALAVLWPGRTVRVAAAAPPAGAAPIEGPVALAAGAAEPTGPDFLPFLFAVWALGAVVSLAWLAWRQLKFVRAAREGRAGPAAVGVLRPRVVTPGDFDARYTARERQVVLAHEAAHIARQDTRVNTAVAVARAVNWFNPLLHLAAHYLRIDQELACDAAVVAAHPAARRAYAEAMLKTQLAARPLPLGCYWPSPAAHPLAERIALLARRAPGRGRRRLGAALVAVMGLGAAGSAWAIKPARIEVTPPPAPPPTATSGLETSVRPLETATARRTVRSPSRPAPGGSRPADDPTEAMAAPEAMAAAPAPWRISSNARLSSVEPGKAVRLVATTFDPQGRKLTNDITAFGSQSLYRTGWYQTNGSRQGLFTRVVQRGDRVWVSASLTRGFRAGTAGTIGLRSGETGEIVLATGQVITVTPTIRDETLVETAEAERALAHFHEGVRRRAARHAQPRTFAAVATDPPF